jgi:hypothetical protein
LPNTEFPFLLLIVEDTGKRVQLDKVWRRWKGKSGIRCILLKVQENGWIKVIDMKRLKRFAKRGVRA